MKLTAELALDVLLLFVSGILLVSIYAHRYFLALLDLGLTGIPQRILRLAACATENGSLRDSLLNLMALRTLQRGDRRLEWVNRLIACGWPYLNKRFEEALAEYGIAKDCVLVCGDLRFTIEQLKLGSRPPKVLSLLVHDESTFQVNPKQMVMDLEVVYNSLCLAVVNCDFPLVGKFKCGIRNFKGDFFMRLILRPIAIDCLGGICISLLKTPKLDFEGLEAATITNNPTFKKIIITTIIDNFPQRFCLPLENDKVRELAYPSPFAICMFQVACKMRPEASCCCLGRRRSKVFVNFKICGKFFKVEAAPSLSKAVWHSTELDDFLETFIVSRTESVGDDNYDLKVTFGSLVQDGELGKIIKVPASPSSASQVGDAEVDDHLTVRVIVLRLNNKSKNLREIINPTVSKFLKSKIPIGFISIYFGEVTFNVPASDCLLITQIGRRKFFTNKYFFRTIEASTRIEECIYIPFVKIPNSQIKLQLIFNCENSQLVSHKKIDLETILHFVNMERDLELEFSLQSKVVAKLNTFVEVNSVLNEQFARLLVSKELNVPIDYL